MGILDFLGTGVEDPRFQAANTMAQSLLGRGSGMQRLAGGLGGYSSVLQVLKDHGVSAYELGIELPFSLATAST